MLKELLLGVVVLRGIFFIFLSIQFCRMGDSVSQGNSFLVSSTKTFLFILVVKHITCNTKVGEVISFCEFFFKKTMQAAVISKKTPTTSGYFRNCKIPLHP